MVGRIFRIPCARRIYTYTHSDSSHYDFDQIDQRTKSSIDRKVKAHTGVGFTFTIYIDQLFS